MMTIALMISNGKSKHILHAKESIFFLFYFFYFFYFCCEMIIVAVFVEEEEKEKKIEQPLRNYSEITTHPCWNVVRSKKIISIKIK